MAQTRWPVAMRKDSSGPPSRSSPGGNLASECLPSAAMEPRDLSVLSYEAVFVVYRSALIQRIREVLTQHFPTSVDEELRAALGSRLDELRKLDARNLAAGRQQTVDTFDLLEPRDFVYVISRHFDLFFPGTRDEREDLLTRMRILAKERHMIAHRNEREPDVAVSQMNLAKQILRALNLRSDASRVTQLIARAFNAEAHTRGDPATPLQSGIPTTNDYWSFYQAAVAREVELSASWTPGQPDSGRLSLLFGPLMQFCQELGDELFYSIQDDQEPPEMRWNWHRGVENVAFAIQDILLYPPWGGRSSIERLMRQVDSGDPPPPEVAGE